MRAEVSQTPAAIKSGSTHFYFVKVTSCIHGPWLILLTLGRAQEEALVCWVLSQTCFGISRNLSALFM